MVDENINLPVLRCADDEWAPPPASFLAYQERWKRDEQEPDPATVKEEPSSDVSEASGDLPSDVTEAAERVTAALEHRPER